MTFDALFGDCYRFHNAVVQLEKPFYQHNQPIELNSNYLVDQKLDYIHNNPVEAGFVHNPEERVYSSAIDHAGGKGFLDVEFLQ